MGSCQKTRAAMMLIQLEADTCYTPLTLFFVQHMGRATIEFSILFCMQIEAIMSMYDYNKPNLPTNTFLLHPQALQLMV